MRAKDRALSWKNANQSTKAANAAAQFKRWRKAMQFGVQMVFQNYNGEVSDAQVYEEDINLGLLAEELGFDALWPVEHHFENYSSALTILSF